MRTFIDMILKRQEKNNPEATCIRRSPLFNDVYYRRHSDMMGVPVGDMDPVLHYIAVGDSKGISTHPLFDTKYYHELYNDISGSKLTALFHFLAHGAKEGRSAHPLICPKFIESQLKVESRNYLLEFIDADIGTVDPHPMINLQHITDQLVTGDSEEDPFVRFLSDKSAKIDPNKKFCLSAYVKCTGITENGNAFYKYASARRLKDLDEYNNKCILEAACRQIHEAADIEPTLDLGQMKIEDLEIFRLANLKHDNSRILESLYESIGDMGADHLFIVPSLDDDVAMKFLRAALFKFRLNEQDPSIYIISGGIAVECRKNDLFGFARIINLDALVNSTSLWDLPNILGTLVQIKSIKNIHVIESDIGWDMFEKFGSQISNFTKLHAHVHPTSLNEFGRKFGYAWSYLSDCKVYLTTITTDCSDFFEILQGEVCKGTCNASMKPKLLLLDTDDR